MHGLRRCAELVISVALILGGVCPISDGVGGESTDLVYSHVENDKMMIALTFDDGPHPRYTPMILDILKKYGVRATFFAVGENAELYPELIGRCLCEGHEVANHTYSHGDLSHSSYDEICREVGRAENAIYETCESRTKLLRPPGGLYGKNVIMAAHELDYTLVLWTVDTRDWAHTPADKIAKKVLSSTKAGDIILMHDFIGRDSPTPKALEAVIPALLERGFRFVTVSELLGSK